tara:strand:- start:138 stop:737 length:600 start_codon:yes stop_codon:yes gene_type:complete
VLKGKKTKLGENTYGINLEDYPTKDDYHYALLKAHRKRHAETYKKKHGHKSHSGDPRYKKDPETGKYIYKFKRDPESFVYKKQNKLRQTEEGRYELKLQSIQNYWGEHVMEWYKKQEPNCRICGKKLKKSSIVGKGRTQKQESVIDHDGTTGITQKYIRQSKNILPRGILCHPCNRGIGFLQEDKNILKNAIKYIEGLI